MEINKKPNKEKAAYIREMLLKTVGKNPALFSYYVNIQEAKELLGKSTFIETQEYHLKKSLKKIVDC